MDDQKEFNHNAILTEEELNEHDHVLGEATRSSGQYGVLSLLTAPFACLFAYYAGFELGLIAIGFSVLSLYRKEAMTYRAVIGLCGGVLGLVFGYLSHSVTL